MKPVYFVRICWNSSGWQKPTREARDLETGTHCAKQGFGYEEWLFRLEWLYKGYHYAFLQPVYQSAQIQPGQKFDALLWSIGPHSVRIQVGEIRDCEVLSDSQRVEAFKHYQAKDWLKQMKLEIKAIEGVVEDWSQEGPFNVRFRPRNAIPYGQPYPLVGPHDRIKKLARYQLIPAGETVVSSQWKRRVQQGSYSLPKPKVQVRAGSGPVVADQLHAEMQKALMQLLQKQLRKKVVREAHYVDITIKHGELTTLVEIKTDPSAKQAIREALGQIMEYAFYHLGAKRELEMYKTKLVIVGPGSADEATISYMEFLRGQIGLPINYVQFIPGDPLPEEVLAKF